MSVYTLISYFPNTSRVPNNYETSRILLEKLTTFQAVKKFSAFYDTGKFITVSTTALHLSYAEPTPSSPRNPLPLPEDPS